MVILYPFPAIRPDPVLAQQIASVPYDVVSADEARACIQKNELSFLRVIRSDAELPDLPPNDDQVYLAAQQRYNQMYTSGQIRADDQPGLYLYRVVQGDQTFLGLVCCLDVEDYINGTIRRHELTRYDKEEDRTRHIGAVNANTGLVFILYRDQAALTDRLASLIPARAPDTEVTNKQGERHQVYRITDEQTLTTIRDLFATVPALYIADGHHRAKSAVNVALKRRQEKTATEESERFMAVLFADDRVKLHGYSRLVTDLGPYTTGTFIEKLRSLGTVTEYGPVDTSQYHIPPAGEISGRHLFHMYLDSTWHELSFPADPAEDQIQALDVQFLQTRVLEPMLGIGDPRGDPRLAYMGGARPLSALTAVVDSGKYAVAFSIQPLSTGTVLAIADNGQVMPPKSTWFEPKLLSGYLMHQLS
ncbi:DUF1015 domain-containing protein [Methanosphaerula subterraneus]|uniref:DUF1015 domain-containing protein n=1 Tax=Methanosphaerula subterraneus TaxID=3350244 RepID=UPI003F83A264